MKNRAIFIFILLLPGLSEAAQCDKVMQILGSRLTPAITLNDSTVPKKTVNYQSFVDDVFRRTGRTIPSVRKRRVTLVAEALKGTHSLSEYRENLVSLGSDCKKETDSNHEKEDSSTLSCLGFVISLYKETVGRLLNESPSEGTVWPDKAKWNAKILSAIAASDAEVKETKSQPPALWDLIDYTWDANHSKVDGFLEKLPAAVAGSAEKWTALSGRKIDLIGNFKENYIARIGTEEGPTAVLGVSKGQERAEIVIFKDDSCQIDRVLRFNDPNSKPEVVFQKGCEIVKTVLSEFQNSKTDDGSVERHQELMNRTFKDLAPPFDNISLLYGRAGIIVSAP
jgi:hypothetical protein